MTKLVSEKIAKEEVEAWLDAKKVRQSQRKNFEKAIIELEDCISEGLIVRVADSNELKVELQFPTEALKSLTLAPRLKASERAKFMKGTEATDQDGRILKMISALSGENSALIGQLDVEDVAVLTSIAIFFF